LRDSTPTSEELLSWVLKKLGEGQRVALITVVEKRGSAPRGVGAKMAVSSDGESFGTIGGGELERLTVAKALEALDKGVPGTLKVNLFRSDLLTDELRTRSQICGGSVTLFVDVLKPSKRAFIIGAGHVARGLARALSMIGYRVVVVDNMPGYASKELIPDADEIIISEDPATVIKSVEFSREDAVVIVHGDADLELRALFSIYEKSRLPAYIGLLSGKGKLAYILKKLLDSGVSRELLAKTLYSPVGLAIGAESPEEVAIAIAAEVLAVERGASAVHESLVESLLRELS